MRSNAYSTSAAPAAALALAAALSACQAAPSSGPIHEQFLPGDPRMDANRMKAHEVRYAKSGGQMIYRISQSQRQDDPVWEVAIHFGDLSGTPDRIFLNRNDLSLRGRRLELKDHVIDVDFRQGRFSGALVPTEGSSYTPHQYDKGYPHGVFEPAILNYAIAALPLAEGFTASLPTLDLNGESSLVWANIEVLGRERVKIDGTSHDTWKVRSHGIKKKTLWISTTEPYVVQMHTSGTFGKWKLQTQSGD